MELELAPGSLKPFSIASAMGAHGPGELEVAVNRSNGGAPIDALSEGAELSVFGPSGSLRWQTGTTPSVFVAAGTGVAPFRAMLQAGLPGSGDSPVLLLFGARREQDILWHDELDALSRRHPRLRFVPTLSRGSERWAGRRGRVQEHFAELVAPLTERGASVYVVGQSSMVDDCVGQLEAELGVPRSRIFRE